ncbi:unnamed protein product [Aphis gossypii]|uniref:Uncharacterized protein n=1 Tax=Aphis gossypii TaxID=80765 RepID=A0A9P0JA32_APHGO|nr:unnamed protein product [Aphis gossypii]
MRTITLCQPVFWHTCRVIRVVYRSADSYAPITSWFFFCVRRICSPTAFFPPPRVFAVRIVVIDSYPSSFVSQVVTRLGHLILSETPSI